MPRSFDDGSDPSEPTGELDLRGIGRTLKRRRRAVLIPTILAFLIVAIGVNILAPRFTAESQVLLENQETFFTRPDRTAAPNEQSSLVDPEAVGSQIQLITSLDLARRAIKDLGLQGDPEFDPAARGMGVLTRVLVLLGIAHDPTQDPADTRILKAFQEKLTVFSPPKTRVITIQFQSKEAALSARVANTMADLYIAEQSSAKRSGAKDAADALGSQIADLRIKLAQADAEREQYRTQSGLLAGSNNMTISGQQLADINSDLSKARTQQADAQAKASMIRELLRAGKTADVPDVINNDLVRRVAEQRVTAQSQLALESRTLMAGHPRVKELTAQVAQLDTALKAAAKQAMSTLENESKIAGQRVANLEKVLTQQKKVAGDSNGDEVRLRSLDRIAQSFKDQLDSSTMKYQEALARENSRATPADARIIARAVVPQDPTFPKKLPFIAFGTIATFVFAAGFVVASEMLSGSPTGEAPFVVASPVVRRRPRLDAVEDEDRPRRVRPEPRPAEAPASARRERSASRTWRGVLEGLKRFGLSAADSQPAAPDRAMIERDAVEAGPRPVRRPARVGWDDRPAPTPSTGAPILPPAAEADQSDAGETGEAAAAERSPVDLSDLAARIVAAHAPGRGLHVVGASLGAGLEPADAIIDLGRMLSERGRAIIVDLNATPTALAALAGGSAGERRSAVTALAGLSELLSGGAAFAEVIHRDHSSRLHFIPTGLQDADFRDFDLILDALSETYDFIVLLAPPFPQSEIAKVMAPYADFVVLTGTRNPDTRMLAFLEAELIEAGAREVLVIGRSVQTIKARAPHVA